MSDKRIQFDNNQGDITIINNGQEQRRATVIGRLIEIIASQQEEPLNLDRLPAEVDHKINFNNLNEYRWLVDEYIGASLFMNESIRQLNQTVLNGSTKLKKQMKRFYYEALTVNSIQTNPFDLDALKTKSDLVVKQVLYLTGNLVKYSSDLQEGYYSEDIEYGVALITSYSIIECVVLENPNDHA